MSDLVREKLAEVVAKYARPPDLDPRRCEGLLRDLCGERGRREINLVVVALKERVVDDLLANGGGVPLAVLLPRCARKLHDQAGIAEDLALWAVESWALALGIIAPSTVTKVSSDENVAALAAGWYYSTDGQSRFGPITSANLRALVASGRLLPEHFVWKEGMAQWVQAGSVKGLFTATPIPPRVPTSAIPSTPTPSQPAARLSRPELPAPSGIASKVRANALLAVKTPATLLLVVGVLGAAFSCLGVCGGLIALAQKDGSGAFLAGFYVVGLGLNLFVAFAGSQMTHLKQYPLVMAGTILAILPCSACWLLGLPVGIWALITLNNPEIKSAFE